MLLFLLIPLCTYTCQADLNPQDFIPEKNLRAVANEVPVPSPELLEDTPAPTTTYYPTYKFATYSPNASDDDGDDDYDDDDDDGKMMKVMMMIAVNSSK